MGVLCIVVATEMLAIDKYIGDCLLSCIRTEGALYEPTILHGVDLVHDDVDAWHRLEEGLGASGQYVLLKRTTWWELISFSMNWRYLAWGMVVFYGTRCNHRGARLDVR